MLWIKAFHVIFMVCWFAGLFYLPRLYVYHAMTADEPTRAQFSLMERKLYYGIMTPCAVLTVILGLGLIHFNAAYYMHAAWMQAKLGLVGLLLIYHGFCWKYLKDFQRNRNRHTHLFFRWFNEIPVVFLIGIVILAIVKPM